MKYSVSIDEFVKDVKGQLDLCKLAGVKYVEIAVRDAGHTEYEKYIKDSVEIFGSNGIEILSFHTPYWPNDISMLDTKRRKDCVASIIKNLEVFGKCCPGKIVVIHPGEIVESGNDYRKHHELAVSSMKEICAVASKYDLFIALENMRHGDDRPNENFKDRFGEDTKAILAIIKELEYKHAGICFDTGHANIAGDIIKKLKDCESRVIHTHISDNLGIRDNHFLPEKGKIPWKEFFEVLTAPGYKGCVNLEIVPQEGMGSVEAIMESKKRLSKYLKFE